ncbi:hypothetical protein Palpr_2888 [Paludibacter propionicigenes WB4]|uniref:Uncharacterized protein n=1 Tax=Paludibacter propionicigenes (strain DSM 17365 / JCM 13257 / WB4) TaxID=694427 RepID=E4T8H3_PALPW|nr:hypothetical protein Palpr_2888 [Paludibacter propionicigenes WB4]
MSKSFSFTELSLILYTIVGLSVTNDSYFGSGIIKKNSFL